MKSTKTPAMGKRRKPPQTLKLLTGHALDVAIARRLFKAKPNGVKWNNVRWYSVDLDATLRVLTRMQQLGYTLQINVWPDKVGVYFYRGLLQSSAFADATETGTYEGAKLVDRLPTLICQAALAILPKPRVSRPVKRGR